MGASIDLTAHPAAGWRLAGWDGDCTASAGATSAQLRVSGPASCTATFEPAASEPPVRITLEAIGGGDIYARVAGDREGFAVEAATEVEVARGARLDLSAGGGPELARFVEWRGDVPGCTGTSPSLTLVADRPGRCVAHFEVASDPCTGVTALPPISVELHAVDVDGQQTPMIGTYGLHVGQRLRVVVVNADEFPTLAFEVDAAGRTRQGHDVIMDTSSVRACTLVDVVVRSSSCGLAAETRLPVRPEPRSGQCP
jgi:hypothetical protein